MKKIIKVMSENDHKQTIHKRAHPASDYLRITLTN